MQRDGRRFQVPCLGADVGVSLFSTVGCRGHLTTSLFSALRLYVLLCEILDCLEKEGALKKLVSSEKTWLVEWLKW
jgi:hypothetical protein